MTWRRQKVRRDLLADYSRRPDMLAILPMRWAVLLPSMVLPVNVGRPRTARLAEWASERAPLDVGVVPQLSPDVEDPGFEDLCPVGAVARVVKVIRFGPDNWSMVLNAIGRFRIAGDERAEPFMRARVSRLAEEPFDDPAGEVARLRELGRRALEGPDGEPGSVAALEKAATAGDVADVIAASLRAPDDRYRHEVLTAVDPRERVRLVTRMLESR